MTDRTRPVPNGVRMLFVLLASLAAATPATASGAGFVITADGAELTPADAGGDVPRYRVKLPVGQTVVLVAQGQVLPRGAAAQPGEADAAAWLFDDAAFELVPADRPKPDRTRTVIALKAVKPGETRVRFVGVILGYTRKFDVVCEVAPVGK